MNWKDQLRKGNIIQTEYGISKICAIAFGDIYVRGDGGRMLHAKKVDPIELTEKILQIFCFQKNGFEMTLDSISLEAASRKVLTDELMCFYEQKYLTRIEYVHQLQNIYWELTGKQLEYKPES